MAAGTTPVFSDLFQAAFIGLLALFSLFVAETVFRYTRDLHQEMIGRVEGEDRPPLRPLLYEMFWQPLFLVVTALILRAGATLLPPGRVVQAVTAGFEVMMIVAFAWFAFRIIRGIMDVAAAQD